jgi:acyl carrier protein
MQILCDDLGVRREAVTHATPIASEGEMGSLDIVELAMELEERFEFTIPHGATKEIGKLNTFGDFLDWVLRHRAR